MNKAGKIFVGSVIAGSGFTIGNRVTSAFINAAVWAVEKTTIYTLLRALAVEAGEGHGIYREDGRSLNELSTYTHFASRNFEDIGAALNWLLNATLDSQDRVYFEMDDRDQIKISGAETEHTVFSMNVNELRSFIEQTRFNPELQPVNQPNSPQHS